MTTRRWYYLIPAVRLAARAGPRHRAAQSRLRCRATRRLRRPRAARRAGSRCLLRGVAHASRWSIRHGCAIPYLSRVDAGTAEAIRARGVEIVSSGDLVQRFEATWSPAQLAHAPCARRMRCTASRIAPSTRVRGAATPASRSPSTICSSRWCGGSRSEGLISDSAPVVAVGAQCRQSSLSAVSASTLRRLSRPGAAARPLGKDCDEPGAVFADITWVAFTGSRVPTSRPSAFDAIVRARDAAVALVEDRRRDRTRAATAGRSTAPRGTSSRRPDSAPTSCTGRATASARTSMATASISTITRRTTTGGSCRAPGSRSSPGLYFDTFGVRTEINVFRGDRERQVTGPRQTGLVTGVNLRQAARTVFTISSNVQFVESYV